MPRGNPPIQIRLDEETQARWKAAATDAGYSLAEYVREAVEERVSMDSPAKKTGKTKKTPPKEKLATGIVAEKGSSKHARTGLCPHRVPATAFCSRCD